MTHSEATKAAGRLVSRHNANGGVNHRPSSGKTRSSDWDPGGPYYRGSDRQQRHAEQALQGGRPTNQVARDVAAGRDPRCSP